jgi:PPOX class probable F420-dependent enzyme
MADITAFANLVPADNGLAVVAIARPDGTVHASVANAGVLAHPTSGQTVVGVVAAGNARKLSYLREHPRATITLRAGWQWAAVEGPVQLIGPDDPVDGVDTERLRLLLREVFAAAGGSHDDWDEYDRVMAEQRRTAILLTPERLYAN